MDILVGNHYVNLIFYGRDIPHMANLSRHILKSLCCLSPSKFMSYNVRGPHPSIPTKSHWPLSRNGLRHLSGKLEQKPGCPGDELTIVPSDAEDCQITCMKTHSGSMYKDTQWDVRIERVPKHEEEWSEEEKRDQDYFDRFINDSTIVVVVNTSIIVSNLLSVIDITNIPINWKQCYYGFVDIVEARANQVGFLYQSINVTPVNRDLEAEERAWWRSGVDRRRCLRSVYWGNYIGPDLSALLTQSDVFDSILSLNEKIKHVSPIKVRDLGNGFVFLTLSDDPLDTHPDSPSYRVLLERREAVKKIVKKAGFLNPLS